MVAFATTPNTAHLTAGDAACTVRMGGVQLGQGVSRRRDVTDKRKVLRFVLVTIAGTIRMSSFALRKACRFTALFPLVLAAMNSTAAGAATGICSTPKFEVTPFKIADDGVDRGFIAGVSVVDVDGDGDLDAYLTRGYYTGAQSLAELKIDRSMLYLNDGKGHFMRDADNALSNTLRVTSGSTWADVFHTGRPDVFVSTELGAKDLFYRNLGTGHFYIDSLGAATDTKGSSFSSTFADIDGDGDMDLVVGGGGLAPPEKNLVFRNDGGTFVRVEGSPLENGVSSTMAVLFADVDNDGKPDFFATAHDLASRSGFKPAGEVETSALYRNLGGWKFERMANEPFDAKGRTGDTAAFGDVDNDGDLDLFVSPLIEDKAVEPEGGRLYLNDGKGHFTENTAFRSKPHRDIAGGAAFADFNGDGNLDLIVSEYNLGIYLYLGDGAGNFAEAPLSELNKTIAAHGSIATGDFDGDGRMDALITNWGEAKEGAYALMLHNASAPCGSWVLVDLKDRHGAADPPHARVTLVTRAKDGTLRHQMRESAAQTGFRSQSGSFFLFAVPEGEALVQADVRWPDGHTETVRKLKLAARNTVSEPPVRKAK
ncbi:MAG: hypothetical protein GC166_12730 [Alphaproteobacteria bacterium]|nr:hypothetical protein [Alphaproteobacteria bacterium]